MNIEHEMFSEIYAVYRDVTQTLLRRRLTVSVMESITGGLVASLLTDTQGSSEVFPGGFVTYSNEAKIHCGVPKEVIHTHSVYSKETAKAMACACKDAYDTDIGIGITGTAGNTDPANPDASVPGEVYFAIAYGEEIIARQITLEHQPDRRAYKLAVAQVVGDIVLSLIG